MMYSSFLGNRYRGETIELRHTVLGLPRFEVLLEWPVRAVASDDQERIVSAVQAWHVAE